MIWFGLLVLIITRFSIRPTQTQPHITDSIAERKVKGVRQKGIEFDLEAALVKNSLFVIRVQTIPLNNVSWASKVIFSAVSCNYIGSADRTPGCFNF